MLTYSQQIDILESHLSVMLQPSRHSPAEIFTLIKRLHETFITFAAQLQFVHEAIKVSVIFWNCGNVSPFNLPLRFV